MLRPLILALLIDCTVLNATAQSIDAPTTHRPLRLIHQKPLSDWPDPAQGYKLPQKSVDIVTIDQSTLRQRCRVHEVKADTITCRADHHRADMVYQRDDIIALIEPHAHDNLVCFLEAGAIVAIPLAASFFVPLAWSLVLRVATGFLFYAGWGACGEASDGLASIGYHDHDNDILLYQRPSTPLTIHLR